MILIRAIGRDEESVICELAKVYQLHDMTLYKPSHIGVLLSGLAKPTAEQLMLACCADRLANLVWMNSEDGMAGVNPPKSMVKAILSEAEDEGGYDSPEEFMEAMKKYG